MKAKLKQIKWEVEDEKSYGDEPEEFDTRKEAMEFVNQKSFGKHFVLYRTSIKRRVIKKINLTRPRPCVGGWYNGHSVSKSDEDSDVKTPFCTICGYQLKRVSHTFGEPSFVVLKPLLHKEDKK